MIFVITGTERYSFDRFVKEVVALKNNGILKEDLYFQLGSCTYEPDFPFDRFIPFGNMIENIDKASMVIAHAGAGTTLLCLQQKKRPVLVTRRAKHKEHVDDHQVPFAENMDKLGYAHVAYEVEDLGNVINNIQQKKDTSKIKKDNTAIVDYLNSWIKYTEK